MWRPLHRGHIPAPPSQQPRERRASRPPCSTQPADQHGGSFGHAGHPAASTPNSREAWPGDASLRRASSAAVASVAADAAIRVRTTGCPAWRGTVTARSTRLPCQEPQPVAASRARDPAAAHGPYAAGAGIDLGQISNSSPTGCVAPRGGAQRGQVKGVPSSGASERSRLCQKWRGGVNAAARAALPLSSPPSRRDGHPDPVRPRTRPPRYRHSESLHPAPPARRHSCAGRCGR